MCLEYLKPVQPRRCSISAFGFSLLGFLLALSNGHSASASATITSAQEVRRLSPEEADRPRTVRLQGVVLHYNQKVSGELTIQDETAAIYVMGTENKHYSLHPGDRVQLEGVTNSGDFAPVVVASDIKVLGRAPVPPPRERTFEQLATGADDGQWVKISGVVRSAVIEPHRSYVRLSMKLATPGGRMTVRVPNVESRDVSRIIDSEATITGTFIPAFNRHRQLLAVRLFVPSLAHVNFGPAPHPIDFDSPPRTINSLMQFDPTIARGHRVKISGVVTLQRPGESLFVRDETQSVWVKTSQSAVVRPGDRVDVLGFPALGEYKPVLEDAVFQRTGTTATLSPAAITAAQACSGDFDAEFVQLESRVVDTASTGDEFILVLQSEETVLRAHLPQRSANLAPEVRSGSQVRLTGVCQVQTMSERAPQSFRLLLRSPADIVVLATPPWWTVRRVAFALGITTAVLAGAMIWVLTLRHRVRAQTLEIKRKVEREAVLEERTRIARDFHDTLGQHLAGVILQLQAAHTRVFASPESARQVLQLAESMLRHTQSEARGAVWELRAQALENGTLASALQTVADYARDGASVSVKVCVEGEPRPFPASVENHLLRIGQEATTNAIRHSEAKAIRLSICYECALLRLVVEDDGKGFNLDDAALGPSGHFGLLGMRERAEKIGGELNVVTAPGCGTRVEILVRVNERHRTRSTIV